MSETQPPRQRLPAGVCDCHTHVFEDAGIFPLSPRRSYTPARADSAMLARHLAAAGLDRVVIVQPSVYGFDNSATLHAISAIGRERARGVAAFDTRLITSRELDSLSDAGMRGARLNLETDGTRDAAAAAAQLRDAAMCVAGRGWHLQVHARLSFVAQLLPVLIALDLPVVLDHYAGTSAQTPPGHPDLAALLAAMRTGNLYVKLSAGHLCGIHDNGFERLAPLARALIAQHPERLLWGSDWPHPNPDAGRDTVAPMHAVDDLAALAAVRGFAGDAGTLRQILATNPARLYGFAPVH